MRAYTSSRHPLITALAASAVAVLLLAGCGGDSDEKSSTSNGSSTTAATGSGPDLSDADWVDMTGEADVNVQARDNIFVKPYIEVKAGATVTFTNRGRNQHNVLAVPEGKFATIEADDLEPGASQEVTFQAPGDYPYYCSLHGTSTKGMVGAIRVVE